MTHEPPSALGEHWRAFDAEAQLLARALRTGRLTVLVGTLGVGMTTLLVAGVLPLLRRRVGDELQQPGGAPQVVEPSPDRRSRVQGHGHSELLHFVDQWNQAPLSSLVQALDDLPAAARVRFDLAEAMSPAHLLALSQRHGEAHLLFVFDHFEQLIEDAQHNPDLQRFVDAWAAAIQAPDLKAHFLVAVDERAWPWLQVLCASAPQVELRAFRLQARPGRQALESLTYNQPGDGAAEHAVSPANFVASVNASLSRVAKLARETKPGLSDFAVSLNAMLSPTFGSARAADPTQAPDPSAARRQAFMESLGARLVPPAAALAPDSAGLASERDAAPEEAARAAAVAEAGRQADGNRRAEAQRAREADARADESRRAAEAAEAARQGSAEYAAAERAAELEREAKVRQIAEAARLVEAQSLVQALVAAEAAAAREAQARQVAEAAVKAAEAQRRVEAERNAEAARQAEAARLVEAQRLVQALAAAEAAAAREVQARQVAEAAVKAAEAQRRVEAERNAEAARQAEAARLVESQRLAQALAAAEATAAREVQARQAAEAATKAAEAERRAEAARRANEAARRGTEAQQRAQEELVIATAAMSRLEPGTTIAAADLLGPIAATAGPARTGPFLGAALLAAAVAAVLWWPTRPTPPAAPVASPPAATAPPHTADSASASASSLASALAAAPAPAESGRYEVLAATAGGTRARIARELAGALSTEPTAVRVVPLADGTEPITWLQTPGRLAVVRFDALRAARGSAAPPLRVLTPLFPEEVLFIVRADSPLKYIHQLRGRRLSIGPVQGDGSHTVREIYRRLFGAEMTEPEQFDNDQALGELVAFRSIDAMAIVEPLPSAWLASLDQHTTRRLRLLSLDLRHPLDRKLLQAVGTSVARTGAGTTTGERTTTPAVMSFLVASGEGDADVDQLTAMARAMCRELPRLRERGHPKWRELQPAAQLDTGWPLVRPFQSVLSRCARR